MHEFVWATSSGRLKISNSLVFTKICSSGMDKKWLRGTMDAWLGNNSQSMWTGEMLNAETLTCSLGVYLIISNIPHHCIKFSHK